MKKLILLGFACLSLNVYALPSEIEYIVNKEVKELKKKL